MDEATHITVSKVENGAWFEKVMYGSVCHYCKSLELLVVDIDDDRARSAVKCATCGMAGPWGCTEEEAVEKWTSMSRIQTEAAGDWKKMDTCEGEIVNDNIPF